MTRAFLLFLLLVLGAARARAQDGGFWPVEAGERIVDLRGSWHLRLGDRAAWADARYDHSAWTAVFVPAAWENEGYPGYDGFAWYRRTVVLDETPREPVLLDLGWIDDVAASYINGRFIGSTGRFPDSYYETAYHQAHRFVVPPGVLRRGINVIAVRVYDEQLEGGLVGGRPGLYRIRDAWPLALDLSGTWALHPGDLPPSEWTREPLRVTVPGAWEPQGLPGYDGFAWYRTTFRPPKDTDRDALVLLLGRVDDLDEVYLNGTRIGRTGRLDGSRTPHVEGDEWVRTRLYPIPENLLRRGDNELAVRVYDGGLQGGILTGPVGIVTRDVLEEGESWLGRLRWWWRMERE